MKRESKIGAESAVVRLSGEEAHLATGVLCEAFHAYPTMRYILGTDVEDYDDQIARLIGFFVSARLLRDEPLLGIRDGADLSAAAMVSYPHGPPSPPELSTVREEVWMELGAEARARYEAFSAACEPLLVTAPHIHLNMIGTRRGAAGRGLGRRLLEHVHRMSKQDSKSSGVTLTTEDPANVTLYEHFGYDVVGQARVSPELETWAFFRPDSG